MLHVAQRLTHAITGALSPRRRNRFELSDELIDALSDEPRLVIVDEAQWLNRGCIEYLRHLHDHPDTRFALLLVGGDGCWEVLSREPMLRSRIYRHVRFSPINPGTVLEVIPRFHPVYADVALDVIAEVDDRYAHGTFRHWASFTHSVLAHTSANLTVPVARDLLELHACAPIPAT
jgi:AAA domain